MAEQELQEQSVLRKNAGLIGVAVGGCVVRTCQFIFDKPKKYKGGLRVQTQ